MDYTRVRAPQLPEDPNRWLNTGGKALQIETGYLYLLDFWTYGNLHCLRVQPDLDYLKQKYAGQPFVVIGIHSGKFANEREAANIRHAIVRSAIRHPVVLDGDHRLWRSFDVDAWPTQVLIDAEGCYLGSVSGEGNRDKLDAIIGTLLETYAEERLLASGAPGGLWQPEIAAEALLSYPGNVLADAAGKRLFIADTGHHRIVVCNLDGARSFCIGSGQRGSADGDFESASFFHPQGMALGEETLYLCDSGNHLLRRIDLAEKTVETIAGTGAPGNALVRPGAGLQTPLSSPWDLCYLEGQLYVAMAGTHQIWRHDIETGATGAITGSGQAARIDGPAVEAAFAQPSGITTDGRVLYVADSQTGCLRRVTIGPEAFVTTVAGGDLFDFGDRNGMGNAARLQHPTGVCFSEGFVYIADTFNHKIKTMAPMLGAVNAYAGTGVCGTAEGAAKEAQFNEPRGLSVARGKLFVVDTNNHRLCVVDMAAQSVSTLEIAGLGGPAQNRSQRAA